MRHPIIAGNWKMNGSRTSVATLLDAIKAGAPEIDKVNWVVFPPAVFLETTEQILSGSVVAWGGQNIHPADSGAFTGEVSAAMLQEYGSHYVLLGHSERRELLQESDEFVAEKCFAAQAAGLTPVFCVGETLAERERGLTESVIERQLGAILSEDEGVRLFASAVVAYEPVWAIGSGESATPEQAQTVHAYIRALIAAYDTGLANECRILYGGSVKPENTAELMSMPDIDGALVGGASLDAQAFLEIGQLCSSCY